MTADALFFLVIVRIPQVHTFHMIFLIPRSRKAVVRLGSRAGGKLEEEGVVSMAMLSVGFTLVSEETSVRRETCVLAVRSGFGISTFVRPEVGIQVFAGAT